MGLWISPCVCLLLSSLPALAVGAQERLPLVNAGFEDDRTGWYPRIESAGPDAISIDREVFHSGAASLRIRQERSSSYSNVVQALDVQRYGNYLARCYVRAEDVVRAGIGINLFIGDIRGMGIGGFVNEEDREGTFEWRQVTVPFNSGKHERITVIPYLHESTGTVWFDDIEVVPIDAGWRPPTGAVTADYTQPPSLPREEQFNWDTVSTEVVTTSTAWATQLASGPLKALVIAPAWSQRESVELAQRCDVEVTPLMTLNRGLLGHGSNQWGMLQIEEARRLAEAKAEGEYDVIVVGKQKWVSLPSNVREKLLVEVRAGCGLVWVLGPGDELPPEIRDAVVPAPEIAAALPLTSLPAFEEHASDTQAAEAIARAGQVGKGRVVVLDYGEDALAGHHYLTPATYAAADGSWTHYEYYQALLIRAVLEAAPAPTEARITTIRCPPIQGGRGSLEAQIECPRNTTAAFTVQVRAASGGYVDVALTQDVDLAAGLNRIDLPFQSRWPSGPCFVDLFVRQDGTDTAFAAVATNIDTGVDLSGPRVSTPSVAPGEMVTVSADIEGGLAGDATVLVRAFDNHGREWARRRIRPTAKAVECRLRARGSLTVLNTVSVEVWSERLLARRSVPLLIRHPHDPEDFSLVLWNGTGSDYIGFRLLKIMAAEYGADAVDMGAGPWQPKPLTDESRAGLARMLNFLAAADVRALPYISRIWPEKIDGQTLSRDPCLSDPAYRTSLNAAVRERALICRDYAPVGYTLGDECFVDANRDVCFSEHCRADFGRFLQARHHTDARLQEAWGAGDLGLTSALKLRRRDAREQGRPAAWVDHRLHMEERFADVIELGSAAIRQVAPDSRVGFDGALSSGSYTGYDWWRLSRTMDVWNTYWQRDQHLAMRSFAQPKSISGLWYGGYVYGPAGREHAQGVRWLPWYSLAHRMTGAWFYSPYASAGGSGEVGFQPDFRPFACWSESVREITEIKRGVGKLILTSEPYPAQVGVVYSPASIHAASFHKLPGHTEALNAAADILEDLCVPFELIAADDLANGALAGKPYRALWLPVACALSEKATSAVERFCRRGGLVVADVAPGAFTESGAVPPRGRLDDLFGLHRSSPPDLKPAIGGVDGFLPMTALDHSVESRDGTSVAHPDGGPVFIGRSVGRGRAFLFNCTLDSYGDMRGPMGRGVRDRVLGLLSNAGTDRPVVLSAGGDVPDRVLTSVFRSGGDLYVLAVRHPEASWEAEEVEVRFHEAGHLYDCRVGEYLGYADRTAVEMMPGDARMWALLPHETAGIHVDMPRRALRGQALALRASIHGAAGPSRRVLRVEVVGPDEETMPWLSRNVVARDGRTTVRVPTALNDPPGTYRVTVRDVATGTEAEAPFTLRTEMRQ